MRTFFAPVNAEAVHATRIRLLQTELASIFVKKCGLMAQIKKPDGGGTPTNITPHSLHNFESIHTENVPHPCVVLEIKFLNEKTLA